MRALGTDRYPPFTLHDVPDYPARLDIPYPERLSRGLVLVKSWLLAIPHLIVVGILLGGGSYAASRAYDRAWGVGYQTGLIGVLVFFAGVALLFTTRYPRGIFDVVLGLDRWVARVAAYVLLMRDEYPPFRLDQGGAETAVPPAEAVPAAELSEHGSCGRGSSARDGRAGRADRRRRRRRDHRVRAVGRRLRARRRRSDPTRRRRLPHVTERRLLDLDVCDRLRSRRHRRRRRRAGARHLPRDGPASQPERPQHVRRHRPRSRGRPVSRRRRADVVTDFDHRDPTYSQRAGGAPATPPGSQTFWAASATGSGEQTLEWKPEDGDWRAVVMNADASRGVSAEMSIGAELDAVLWIGIGLLAAGVLFAAVAAIAVTAGVRRGHG